MSDEQKISPPGLQIQELKPSDGIRWAVGEPNSKRGSTWRFWANKKGDFYLAVRSLGGTLKTSLHRDRRCHTGFTGEFLAKVPAIRNRHMDKWQLEDEPLVSAVQVVTPWQELENFQAEEAEPMKWLPPPPAGSISLVTVFVLRPDYRPENNEPWPGAHLGLQPIGFAQTKLRTAFLVSSTVPLAENTAAEIEAYRARILANPRAGFQPGVRAILFGNNEGVSRFFIELGYKPRPN